MKENEKIYYIDGVEVKYKLRYAKFDCKHLLVIFSGFGADSNITYNFSGNTLDFCPSNILWIKDDFLGNCCYYLCHKMNFIFERCVNKLILDVIDRLYLTKENVTLCGGSKGATAALYFGIKYNYKNIICSAPQVMIGDFNKKVHKDVYEHMIKCEEDKTLLNNIIKENISDDKEINKNIYLFSSPVDEWEKCENLHEWLKKYKNFNHFITYSSCVLQHNMVTSYNVPLILSLILCTSQNISPIFGEYNYNGIPIEKENIRKIILERQISSNICIATINKFEFCENKFFLEGVAFIKGYDSPSYGLFKKNLILKNINASSDAYYFPLGSILNKYNSKTYFDSTFCDYTSASYATLDKKGLALDVPFGTYVVSIKVEGKGKSLESFAKLECGEKIIISDKAVYRMRSREEKAYFQKIPLLSIHEPDIFQLKERWKKDAILHYAGIFAVYGIELENWSECTFYIVLKKENTLYGFYMGKNNYSELNNLFEGYGIYSKSNFCTYKGKGIDISRVESGHYMVYVSLLYKGSVFSRYIEEIDL